MFEEQKAIDKIEILEDGTVQVREVTRVLRDGEQIAHSYFRWVLSPGQDLSGQPARVQAICAAAWAN